MEDNILPEDGTPSSEPTPSLDETFTEMEAALDQLPSDALFYTVRHEANPPMYVPGYEGESVTIRQVCSRRNLTLGGDVNAYVDGAAVSLDAPVAIGAVITLVGNVKGG